jgi:hypothetical protein
MATTSFVTAEAALAAGTDVTVTIVMAATPAAAAAIGLNHRYLSATCLVCLISTVNGCNKKEALEDWR